MSMIQTVGQLLRNRFYRSSVATGYQRQRLDDMGAAMRGWSYACMNRRAETVARIELQLTDNNGNPLGDHHWLSWVFQKPNPMMTTFDIIYNTVMWRDVQGNAFVWTPTRKTADGRAVPYQMWVIPANQVEIYIDQKTGFLGYVWNSENGRVHIPRTEMIHFKMMRPGYGLRENMFLGQPLITACIDEIQTSYEIKSYLRKYFENDAIPPLVFTSPGKMTNEEWDTFRSRWNEKMPKHRIAGILENGSGVQPITRDGLGTVDKKDTQAITTENIDIICSVFGLNRGLLTGDFAERATAEVQKDLFMSNTVDTILAYMDEVLTSHFRQFDARVTVRHNRKQFIDPVEERMQEMHDFTLGIVSRNDLRKKRGLDAIDDGDTYYLLNTVLPADMVGSFGGFGGAAVTEPAPEPTTEPEPPAPPEPTQTKSYDIVETPDDDVDPSMEDVPSTYTDPTLSAIWKQKDNEVAPYRDVLERSIRNVFLDMMDDVVARVDNAYVTRAVNTDVAIIDLDKWRKILETAVKSDTSDLVQKFMEKAATEVGRDWSAIVSDFEIDQRAALNESLAKIKQTVPKIDEELRGLLRANSDKTAAELKDMITNRFKNVYSGSRAAAIARTTATFATNNAQKKVWQKLKFKRQILSQRDGAVRLTHRQADGQIEDTFGMFTIAGYKTGQPAGDGLPAKEAVNCRCYTRAVKVDEAGNATRKLRRKS